MEVQTVEQEDVPNQEQPVVIQPKVIAPKVLLEILVYGLFEPGTDPKESDTYKNAIALQEQIDALRGKDKFRVRILWRTLESSNIMTRDQQKELKEWLIEHSSCKYYYFASVYAYSMPNYVKNLLKEIKYFEKALAKFKDSKIELKRK